MWVYIQVASPPNLTLSQTTISSQKMSPPKTSHLFFIFFLFLVPLHFKISSSNKLSTLCPATYCTEGGTPIKYPFWLANDDPTSDHYCGYPDFGLSCSDGRPVISISDDEFYVQDMDYGNSTVTLVDTDVANQTCPRVKHNLTLTTLPLDSNSNININLSFYFNCTSTSFLGSLPISPIPISCLGQDKLGSYVIEVASDVPAADMPVWSGSCEDNVMVAVMRAAVPSNYSDLISRWSDALNDGFVLDWRTVSDCGKCEASGGYCGSNKTTNRLLCFCEDGEIISGQNSCKGKHSKSMKAIIIGVVPGVAILLLISLVCWIICQRRKRRRYAPSSFASRSISSGPSSRSDVEKGSRYMGVHLFTYTELVEATNNFDEKKELGDGGFGTVYYGKLKDGREVAVKRLYENNYRRVEQFMNEVDILTRLQHKNLVILYGCTSRHSRELLLVYEYIDNGTVADHLHGVNARSGSLPWPLRLNIAVETARALKYLHASDIIHRDVKTNNILLDKNFCVKVADFGLSRLFPMDVTHISTAPQGTPGYVDPEYHQCYQLTDKSDVYSFGVVLAELISSLPAVDITRHRHEINLFNMAINKIQNQALHEFVDPSLGFSSDETVHRTISAVAELAFQCLQSAKELRPTMDEVLETLATLQAGKRDPDRSPDNDTTSDDVGLLKYGASSPLSPVSVTAKWSSSSGTTTPNTSS